MRSGNRRLPKIFQHFQFFIYFCDHFQRFPEIFRKTSKNAENFLTTVVLTTSLCHIREGTFFLGGGGGGRAGSSEGRVISEY